METAADEKWRKGDGLLQPAENTRQIIFKNGFVRVRDPDYKSVGEKRAGDQPETLDVPPRHRCEVLGAPDYYFVNS